MEFREKKEIESFARFLKKIIQEVTESFDLRDKIIGDRVDVWNLSSMTDMDQNIAHPTTRPEYFIVIAINQEKEFKPVEFLPFSILQDLVVVEPRSKEKYRVSSNDVRLIEKENN